MTCFLLFAVDDIEFIMLNDKDGIRVLRMRKDDQAINFISFDAEVIWPETGNGSMRKIMIRFVVYHGIVITHPEVVILHPGQPVLVIHVDL